MARILSNYGYWVGPPLLKLQLISTPGPQIIDGRKRWREYRDCSYSFDVPIQTVRSHYEAIRALIDNSHHDRAMQHAEKYVPQLLTEGKAVVQALLGFKTHHKLIPFWNALKAPEERHKLPRRAIRVVNKLRTLYRRAQEGHDVTLEDLEKTLGEFIDD